MLYVGYGRTKGSRGTRGQYAEQNGGGQGQSIWSEALFPSSRDSDTNYLAT
jgi:hypothetical protein